MTDILQAFAAEHECIIGVCDASPLCPTRLGSGFVPFVSRDINKRVNPEATLPGVQSIVAIGVGYCSSLISHAPGTAQLSSLGTNDDYHPRVKALLRQLVAELAPQYNFKHKILVDSPTLCERSFAQRAGIGFLGRNGLLISQKFGSRFNIGLLLTTLAPPAFNHDVSFAGCPPSCHKCINACPAGALKDAAPLDAVRCISYITQKKDRTPQEDSLIGNQLYGCDICQDVCPFNAPRAATTVDPQQWLNMSDQEFTQKYAHTAMLWQGAELLRRNANANCQSTAQYYKPTTRKP